MIKTGKTLRGMINLNYLYSIFIWFYGVVLAVLKPVSLNQEFENLRIDFKRTRMARMIRIKDRFGKYV